MLEPPTCSNRRHHLSHPALKCAESIGFVIPSRWLQSDVAGVYCRDCRSKLSSCLEGESSWGFACCNSVPQTGRKSNSNRKPKLQTVLPTLITICSRRVHQKQNSRQAVNFIRQRHFWWRTTAQQSFIQQSGEFATRGNRGQKDETSRTNRSL